MASYGRAASKDYIYSEDIEKTITNFKWLVFILNVISLLTGKNVFCVSFLLQILAPKKLCLYYWGKAKVQEQPIILLKKLEKFKCYKNT